DFTFVIQVNTKICLDQWNRDPLGSGNLPLLMGRGFRDSTMSPFSDKLMLYNTSLLSDFGIGSSAIGTSFSLRKDLPMKMMMIAKDILEFANDGGNLAIKHGWMEEPPQMEDRTHLSNQ
ncbi:DUF3231 family protein, partial [Siminovitchia fortis]